jgi:colanic acid biosynthesis glycosyl transferase WcaI
MTDLQLGLLSQWYEPEPTLIPSVLARELARRGHSVRVLTGFPNYPTGRIYDGFRIALRSDHDAAGVGIRRVALYASHSGSRVGRVANYVSFAVSASLASRNWFKETDALWVANSPPTVGLPMWLTKRRGRPRIVLHILDFWPESLQASGLGGPFMRVPGFAFALNRWLSMTHHVADSIVCSSRAQMDLLARRGVPRRKLEYVPIWVDESIFQPAARDESLAERLGVKDKTVLLYAGAIGQAQGLDVLVEVCERLRHVQGFHCLIAGTGVAETRLRSRVASTGLSNVTFLGAWPASDMRRLMSVGDVHFASLRQDPISGLAMPSKVPATLACAKPLIVSAGGEVAEIVSRSGCGWACKPEDADDLEAAVRSAIATGRTGLEEMGELARRAYEGEFAARIGVERIERLMIDNLN